MEQENSPFRLGSRVGNYILDEVIGTGGIGTVYKAHHAVLQSTVAIKVHDYFPQSDLVGLAFMQAANSLSQLNHPGIVRLNDFGFHADRAFIAMEYVDGPTLANVIPSHLTEHWTRQAIDLFIQLLSAVRYAHTCSYIDLAGKRARGIVHGDIKPANVMLSRDLSTIKLGDFMMPDVQMYLGKELPDLERSIAPYLAVPVSRYREVVRSYRDWSEAAVTRAFGTAGYMAPEQLAGKLSPRSDVFSLGVTFYELLTNCPAATLFEGEQPRQINPFIPGLIEDLVLTATRADPDDRFQSVSEMEAVILEFISRSRAPAILSIGEWIMGDKIEFNNTGTINTTGQLFIGKFNDVVAHLQQSGNADVADSLKLLKDAVMQSAGIPPEAKQEHVEVISQFAEEAGKPNPNRTMLKIMWDGLSSALHAVPDVAKAVAAAAPVLSSLLHR